LLLRCDDSNLFLICHTSKEIACWSSFEKSKRKDWRMHVSYSTLNVFQTKKFLVFIAVLPLARAKVDKISNKL
jgi:hypothetical protein